MTTIAFIGLGRMGSRMAHRLLEAGHDLVVWNRSPDKMSSLVEAGAKPASSPAEAARQAEVIITMVADPTALRAVTEVPDGIAAGMDQSATHIEMSTVGPAAIERLVSTLPEGTAVLDAPVLGSLAEVERGELHIFVGGPPDLAERWTPLLSILGSPIHVGPTGAGASAKLVANASLLGVIGLLGETLALALSLGLARDTAFEVLARTPLSAQAERRRQAIEREEYPARFALSLARKDADLILEAGAASGTDLRLVRAARTWLAEAEEAGWGDRDYAAVLEWIIERSSRGKDGP
jgi:3-hydroxyisobutyrate dehydrogenase-like beta-hydroxyacid dehydrogenase